MGSLHRLLAVAAIQLLFGLHCVIGHSASTGFLRIHRTNGVLTGQLELPLRDLEDSLGIDANDDGKLTWGELKSREGNLVRYVESRLIFSAGGSPIPLRFGSLEVNHHQEDGYAVFNFDLPRREETPGLTLTYRILLDQDPLHRCLVNAPEAGITGVITRERAEIQLAGTSTSHAQAASFISEGAHHIWSGYDHLLFLLALLLPAVLRRTDQGWAPAFRAGHSVREVLKVVTAFTVAHSLTLSAAALGLVQLPSRFVESAIAGSILIAALANLRPRSAVAITPRPGGVLRFMMTAAKPWTVAFVFGLIHGFGFAGALDDLGLRSQHIAVPLIAFNLGVELGQLACVAAFLPLALLLRKTNFYRHTAVPLGSAAIMLLAGGWLVERLLGLGFMPF